MNLMQQHEQVIKEIDAYYSFRRRIQWWINLRTLKPRSFIPYCSQIAGPWFMGLFSRKKRLSEREMWTAIVELLSSETEKTSPFYDIVRTGPSPVHPLSEYLANKFSNYNWADLEKANRVHENVLPKFGLVRVLMEGVNILVIIAIVRALLDGSLLKLIQQQLIQGHQLLFAALIYTILFLSIFLFKFWNRRVRLQRAGNVLKYLTILYPTGRRCNNDAGDPAGAVPGVQNGDPMQSGFSW